MSVADSTTQPRLPSTLADKLMFIAICAIPFQQALTLPVGFPLKISEMMGILAVMLYATEARPSRYKYAGAAFQWLLLAFVAFSTLAWLLVGPPADHSVGYERGLDMDMLLYFGYAVLVIVISWFAGSRLGPTWISAAISLAIRLCAVWAALQGVLFLLGSSNLLAALRGTQQIGTAYGFGMPRNGPFLEGNYLGFFAGVALLIVWSRVDRKGRRDGLAIVASLFCLFYSQSTVALVAVLAAILFMSVVRPSGRIVGALSFVGLIAVLVVSFVDSIGIYVSRQLAKLGLINNPDFGASIEYSMRNRSATVQRGLDMWAEFPWLGVGPGRYGYWDEFFTTSSYSVGGRGIANNAYVQVLAEVGVVAALCFVAMIALLLIRHLRGARSSLALAVFVIIGLNATPSWTVLPIWVAVAYLATTRTAEFSPQTGPFIGQIGGTASPRMLLRARA